MGNRKQHHCKGDGSEKPVKRLSFCHSTTVEPSATVHKARPQSTANADSSSSSKRRETRLIRKLLNKLTPTNFGTLVTEFVTEACLSSPLEVVKSIVDRAATDVRFAPMLSSLCRRLALDLVFSSSCTTTFRQVLWQVLVEEALAASTSDGLATASSSSLSLLSSTPVPLTAADDQLARQVFVGKMRFVGHLCNHNVFTVSAVLSVMETLMEQAGIYDTTIDNFSINERALEALCALLSTCGQVLEASVTSFESMQSTWAILQDLVHRRPSSDPPREPAVGQLFSFRSEHLVLELLELHASAWNSTRYSVRQRREMVAKPLLEHDRVQPRDSHRSQQRTRSGGSKKKKNRVHFGSMSH